MKNKNVIRVTLSLMAILGSSGIQAEVNESEADVERIVVVSSRVETPIREIATSVSVISEEDIEARGYASLGDLLRVQPAVHSDNSGGLGSVSSIRIRGEEGYRTLIRIDGVDISDPTGTQVQPQFGQLQSAGINRIEILRGPQGLAYGADAGGVINIESGYVEQPFAGSLSAEYGSFNTKRIVADVGGKNAQGDFYLSVADYSSEGFNSRIDDDSADKDGYDNTTAHGKFGFQATEALALDLVFRDNSGDGEYDNCFTASFAPSNDCTSKFGQTNVRLSGSYQLSNSAHELAYSKTEIEREFFTEGDSTFMSEGELERVEYIGDSRINDVIRVVYGVDWEKEVIDSSDLSRTQTGIYLEGKGKLGNALFLTAGLRNDDNDDFGNHTSYRVSAAYIKPVGNNDVKFRASYGTGFRAPSLFEVDYNNGPFAFPPASDTELKEETTKGYEIGIEFLLRNGSSYQAVYFEQDVEDAIFFDLTGFSGYLQETGTSTSKGVEFIADVTVSEYVRVTANYTYNDTKDSNNMQRIRRPDTLANVGLHYAANNIKLAAHVRWVEGVVDAGMDLDSYYIVDVSARYQFSKLLEAFARLENALDEEYQDIAVFNTPGAAVSIGLKLEF